MGKMMRGILSRAELINLPHDHVISMFVVIGKATQEARLRGLQLDLNEVVVSNHF